MNVQQLQELAPRTCFSANRMESGLVFVATPDVPDPWALMQEDDGNGGWNSYDEEAFRLMTRDANFGACYLRDRETVEREYAERARNLAGEGKLGDYRETK
jgi:hypothetical protein